MGTLIVSIRSVPLTEWDPLTFRLMTSIFSLQFLIFITLVRWKIFLRTTLLSSHTRFISTRHEFFLKFFFLSTLYVLGKTTIPLRHPINCFFFYFGTPYTMTLGSRITGSGGDSGYVQRLLVLYLRYGITPLFLNFSFRFPLESFYKRY